MEKVRDMFRCEKVYLFPAILGKFDTMIRDSLVDVSIL